MIFLPVLIKMLLLIQELLGGEQTHGRPQDHVYMVSGDTINRFSIKINIIIIIIIIIITTTTTTTTTIIIRVKVKLSLCFSLNRVPRHEGVLGECRYSSTHSLTPGLDGGQLSASRPGRFTPKERAPGTHWIGGWVGPRAVMDTVVKRKIPSPPPPRIEP
jgi:hypothetical protein